MDTEKIIENHIIKGSSPGISVGILQDNNIQTFNFGETKKHSGILPTSNTVYEIGSVTKPFAGILAAILEDEGLFSLDDTIVKYLPQLKNSDIENSKITIRHLITNTGDLPSTLPLKTIVPYLLKLYLKMNTKNPFENYPKENLYEYLRKRKIKKIPGTTWSYSNFGYSILGHICENVTDQSFENLIVNKICKPLGMNDTGINLLESHKDRLATGYTFSGKQSNFWSSPSMEGMISLRSTVDDLLLFAKANLGINQSKISHILENCISTEVNPKLTTFMKYYPKYAYGLPLSKFRLGWFVYNTGNTDVVGIDGGTEGFSSFLIMNMEKKSAVTVLTNKLNPKPTHKLGMSLIQN
ncbi:MAG: beta-lactamase family protein [Nitrosopumilus sp.]|nr:beta-lactamase family protein [Nitrosopumilus sp.]